MNANKILDDLSCKLDSFNPAERKNALEEFKKAFVTAGESFVCEKNDNNMHCHTFFSFNGYGYSPTHVACWAKAERLFSAGLIDFDVLDGVDEFLAAARELDLRASCGVESRVVVKEMLDKVINSPGEPGIAYHLGVGFTTSGIPAEQRKYLDAMKAAANARTRGIVEKVNPALSLDYIVAPPQMAHYLQKSAEIYGIYLRYIAPEDIHPYSIDEVFIEFFNK